MKMYNSIQASFFLFILVLSSSCGPNIKENQKVIDKYCLLNMKLNQASPGPEKIAAADEKRAYEKEVDAKYFKDYKNYQFILEGMQKCNDAVAANTSSASTAATPIANDLNSLLAIAKGDAATAAKTYCDLIDQSINAAKSGTDDELKQIVATKFMFEKKMEESFKNDVDRRETIFKLIQPCIARESRFRNQ